MKIAIWHNLPSGGGKRALYDQVQALRQLGHHVEAWCPPTADQNFLPLSPLVKEHILPLIDSPVVRTGPIGRRIHFIRGIMQKIKQIEDHCRRCAEAISRESFDLLFVHPCQFFHTSPIAGYTTLPTVLYLQEPFRSLYEAWPSFPWAAPTRKSTRLSLGEINYKLTELIALCGQRIQAREEAKWAKDFDQILVNSLFSRESLVRIYNTDAKVCYLGVDTLNFRPTASPKERFVIGLGSLYFHKRPLFALRCISAIPVERRPKLIWVGNSGSGDEVSREATKLGVDFDSRILISDEELRDLLSRAAVMIYASHLEPFGYAPLEANACGTAVVGLAEGGIRETMNHPDCGILIDNLDPVAFGKALLTFCDDLEFAAELGRKARARVENCWSKEIAAKALEAELEKVVATAALAGD